MKQFITPKQWKQLQDAFSDYSGEVFGTFVKMQTELKDIDMKRAGYIKVYDWLLKNAYNTRKGDEDGGQDIENGRAISALRSRADQLKSDYDALYARNIGQDADRKAFLDLLLGDSGSRKSAGDNPITLVFEALKRLSNGKNDEAAEFLKRVGTGSEFYADAKCIYDILYIENSLVQYTEQDTSHSRKFEKAQKELHGMISVLKNDQSGSDRKKFRDSLISIMEGFDAELGRILDSMGRTKGDIWKERRWTLVFLIIGAVILLPSLALSGVISSAASALSEKASGTDESLPQLISYILSIIPIIVSCTGIWFTGRALLGLPFVIGRNPGKQWKMFSGGAMCVAAFMLCKDYLIQGLVTNHFRLNIFEGTKHYVRRILELTYEPLSSADELFLPEYANDLPDILPICVFYVFILLYLKSVLARTKESERGNMFRMIYPLQILLLIFTVLEIVSLKKNADLDRSLKFTELAACGWRSLIAIMVPIAAGKLYNSIYEASVPGREVKKILAHTLYASFCLVAPWCMKLIHNSLFGGGVSTALAGSIIKLINKPDWAGWDRGMGTFIQLLGSILIYLLLAGIWFVINRLDDAAITPSCWEDAISPTALGYGLFYIFTTVSLVQPIGLLPVSLAIQCFPLAFKNIDLY